MSREFDLIDVEGVAKSAPKHVLVVGGGLAGLEAARCAAFSGHRVTLCERSERIGGQLLLAAKMPARSELADILPWYIRQLNKYGVDVRLSVDVDRALIEQMKVDTVIVATGSLPEVPQHLINIVMNVANIKVLMLDDMIRDDSFTGAKALVIGGNQNGILACDWLAERGAEVWVAEAHGHFGEKLAGHDRWYLLNRLAKKPVHRMKNVRGIEVGGNDDVWLVTDEGTQNLPGIDTIVFASDRRADRGLAEVAEKLSLDTYVVGDAHDAESEDASTILATIQQAYDVARRI